MNDIYRQQKRTMTSKQFSAPPPPSTRSRRLYENTHRTKHYQPVDIQLNTHSTTNRIAVAPYFQHSTISNRSHNNNNNVPYASSTYGVYRRSLSHLKTPPAIYNRNHGKRIDLRNHSEERHLSRSISDDYYYPKYEELNGLISAIYGDEKEKKRNDYDDEDEEENCSEIFNYTFDGTGVSLRERKKRINIYKIQLYLLN